MTTTTATTAAAGADDRRQHLTLSCIAYVGMWGHAATHPASLLALVNRFLEEIPAVRGRWQVAWGPGIARLGGDGLTADNMIYVVRDGQDRSRYAVVIRGTNPLSIPDMATEVQQVYEQRPWPYGGAGTPQIALGVSIGLSAIQGMVADAGVPGAGRTLGQFLADATSQGEAIRVSVAGHSLGATLASTLALWLAQVQGSDWDAARKSTVSATTFAGFTAGNPDFAAAFDAVLGGRCDRVANSLDIVPHTFAIADIQQVMQIYQPHLATPFLFKLGLNHTIDRLQTAGVTYQHVQAGAAPLPGVFNTAHPHFFQQMIWQHVEGYLTALGLDADVDVTRLLTAHV
jgi:ubiquinone biosynthesis protein